MGGRIRIIVRNRKAKVFLRHFFKVDFKKETGDGGIVNCKIFFLVLSLLCYTWTKLRRVLPKGIKTEKSWKCKHLLMYPDILK